MPPPHETTRLNSTEELGLGRKPVGLAVLSCAILPAGTAVLLGAGPESSLGVLAGGLLTAAVTAHLLLRHLTRNVVHPMRQVTLGFDELRSGRLAGHLDECGPPMMLAMMRRFNQACTSIVERDQMSRANLLSVEVAFDRVHSVLQSLREGVVVIDDAGRIVLANRSARQVLADTEERVEGRLIVDTVTGDLLEGVSEALRRIDEAVAEEVKATDLHQGDRILDMTLVKVRSNRPDRDFGKVLVLVDVTKNHEIGRLKDELLSSISHELRTPLTNLCSSSEILAQLSAKDEAEWREFVDIVSTESHRLKCLVNDVMEYSRMETGQIDWTRETVDLKDVVRRSLGAMQSEIESKNITVEPVLDHDYTTAIVDSLWVHQALMRLLDNAVKFTPESGTIRVTIGGHKDLVEVAVDDSGAGIPTEDRERVFERFSQLGDLMTEKPKGAGLGLAICRRAIDAMGGTLWCEDSELGGARFRFVLPKAADNSPIA